MSAKNDSLAQIYRLWRPVAHTCYSTLWRLLSGQPLHLDIWAATGTLVASAWASNPVEPVANL